MTLYFQSFLGLVEHPVHPKVGHTCATQADAAAEMRVLRGAGGRNFRVHQDGRGWIYDDSRGWF